MKTTKLLFCFCFFLLCINSRAQQTFKIGLANGGLTTRAMMPVNADATIVIYNSNDPAADLMAAKIDRKGNVAWTKQYKIPGVAYFISSASDKNGGFAMLIRKGSGDDGYGVIGCDSLGNISWKKTFKLAGGRWYFGFTGRITSMSDGGYALATVGRYKFRNGTANVPLAVVRLDNTGKLLWQSFSSMYAGNFPDYDGGVLIDAIGETPGNGVVVAKRHYSCETYCHSTVLYGFNKNGKSEWSQVLYDRSTLTREFQVMKFATEGKNLYALAYILSGNPTERYGYISLQKTAANGVLTEVSNDIFTLDSVFKSRGITAFRGQGIHQDLYLPEWTDAVFKNDGTLFLGTQTLDQYDRDHRICPAYSKPFTNSFVKDTPGMFADAGVPAAVKDSLLLYDLAANATAIPNNLITICSGNITPAAKATNVVMATTVTRASFNVYPNPAKNLLHIRSSGNTTIVLTDMSGKTMLTKQINGNTTLDITTFTAGLYFIKDIGTGVGQKVFIVK